MAVNGTIVIDPGHGGTTNMGGSDANHAVTPSGVKEKAMTLEIGLLVRNALRAEAAAGGHTLNIKMTRTTDVNHTLADRAHMARLNKADRFLSIHFNGFDKVTRGVETHVRPVADGNVNFADDMKFARKIQQAAFGAVKANDAGTKDRGVFKTRLGVLNDVSLGNTTGGKCRACLLELEFIDVPAVDRLLNTNANAPAVRGQIAQAIARAIIDDLANP